MTFKVWFKGQPQFTGTFNSATQFVERTWGSVAQAYEQGVRLQALVPSR